MISIRNANPLLAGLWALACGAPAMPVEPPTAPPWVVAAYPETRVEEVIDVMHGATVADPYRWLEDDDSEEVRAWQAAQTALTRDALDAIPGRERVRDRLAEVFRVAEEGVPVHHAGLYFQRRRDANQDQPVLYVSRGFPGERRALVDPNALGQGDNTVALDWWYPSPDGSLVAFGLSDSGSERSTLHVVRTKTSDLLPVRIPETRSSKVAWLPDGSGFYYTRRPAPDSKETWFNRVFFHLLGTDWQDDPLVFGHDSGDEAIHWPELSPDGEQLVIHVLRGSGGTETDLYHRPAKDARAPFTAVARGKDATFRAEVQDDRMVVRTNYLAPRYRVIEIDYAAPGEEHWKELVPEGEDIIDSVLVISGHMVLRVMRHAAHRLFLHAAGGERLREIELPGIGRVAALSARFDDEEFFYGFTSFFHAGDIYRRGPADAAAELVGRIETPVDPERYEAEQVFYTSKDGTRVPMFLARLVDRRPAGPRPVVMYAYGGFNIALTPFFLGRYLPFIEAGGVFAMPGLRGGSEYGEQWHRQGMREHKQNVFDDFHAAAEYLVGEGITEPAMLGVRGGSNGGLLVGAALVQRPDLYGAVVCAVPLLDMLRYHKFLIARLWVGEYGSAEDPEQFAYLRAYSPYHNVPEGAAFPPTLITTAEVDSRVAPLHARKMAAMLQARQAGDAPILLYVEQKAGHGQGKPIDRQIEDTADHLAFLMRATGLLPGPAAAP